VKQISFVLNLNSNKNYDSTILALCQTQQCVREKLKNRPRATRWWYASSLSVLTGWILVFLVDKNCNFVEIQTTESKLGSSSLPLSFGRGTHRGKLLPTDSCRAWGQYDDLDLDLKMVATRTSDSLSIVLLAIVLATLLFIYFCRPLPCLGKWLLVALCILVSAFQAMTHLMVHSKLCKDVQVLAVDPVNGREVLYDECSKDTMAYNLPFATMALGVVAGLLIAILPLTTEEEAQLDGTDKGQQVEAEHEEV